MEEVMEEKNYDEVNIDILELLSVLWSKAALIMLVGVLFAVCAFGYTKLFIPNTYASNISLYVKNTNTTVESLNANDITASQTLATTYISILDEDIVMDNIAQKLMNKYDVEQLAPYFSFDEDDDGDVIISTGSVRSKINYSLINETELIRVTAYCENPIIATDMCTFVADIAPDMLVRVVGAGAVETVGIAKVPKTPVGPNAKKNSVIAFLIGAIIVAAIVVLRYMFDKTIKSVDNLKNKVDLPLLAEIPFYTIEKDGKTNSSTLKRKGIFAKKNNELEANVLGTIADVEVPFVVNEAYNTFRTNVSFALATAKGNVVVVSSSFAGEGKSTSAANMCISMGETNSRVLLIDADLRRPTQHKLFNLNNDIGLSTVLGGMSSIEDSIHKNVHGNLDVITVGKIPPNPSQMIASEKMKELIEELSPKYDLIVIDTPPVNVVSDALSLLSYATGIIIVTRQNVSNYDELNEAIERVRFADGNIFGLIVNSTTSQKKGYSYSRGYRYRYNYSYGSNNKEGKEKK
jgi:capsular exopolysaccharide synthesis family protein